MLGINEPAGHDQEHRVRHHRPGLRGRLGRSPSRPPVRTGKKVAVVGSGPAGLACAAQLNKAGHCVTVFERADRIGGLLMYGIPNMKLDKKYRPAPRRSDGGRGRRLRHELRGRQGPARRRSSARTSTPSCCAAARRSRTTSSRRRRAGTSRASTSRWSSCTPTPRACSTASTPDGNYLSAKDKDVIVIGGGDTGTDCVGTSLRHGCRSLLQLEIVPRPPLDARRGQPLAAVAEGLQARLRPGRGEGPLRRRPAPVRRSRRRSSSATTRAT